MCVWKLNWLPQWCGMAPYSAELGLSWIAERICFLDSIWNLSTDSSGKEAKASTPSMPSSFLWPTIGVDSPGAGPVPALAIPPYAPGSYPISILRNLRWLKSAITFAPSKVFIRHSILSQSSKRVSCILGPTDAQFIYAWIYLHFPTF